MSSFSRVQLEAYLKGLDVKAKTVLDIGGAQAPIKGRTHSWEVEDYVILDNGEGEIKEGVEFVKGDIQDFAKLLLEPSLASVSGKRLLEYNPNGDSVFIENRKIKQFEAVFCLEVSEYLINPIAAMNSLRELVAPKGMLIMSFQFLYPLHPPTGKDYLRYTRYGVLKLLESHGFKVEEYVPRLLKNKELWNTLMAEEGYRFDRSVDPAFLHEAGCIIRATKQ